MVKILKIINETFDNLLGKIPCYNTIENWVKKCGLSLYNSSGERLRSGKYAQIVDESMMIGSEKLLLTLAIPAQHQGAPLNCSNINILDMAVAESWNSERVKTQLESATSRVGNPPEYVISDNAIILSKGIKSAGFKHQRDISHSLGMFLERTYKNEPDFITYCKLMTEPKFKYNMKRVAYLLPPKQRTIARFINMSDWIKWSSKLLEIYHTLSKQEKLIFSFIPSNASLIEELSEVMRCINNIESLCKNKGLSEETVVKCQQEIKKGLLNGNQRMIQLGEDIGEFLKEEIKNVKTGTTHNNSSDIIESIFGKYKSRKSPNKLNGVTSFILFMPLYTRLSGNYDHKFNFKKALENNTIKDINLWSKENLSQNLMQLRNKKLNKVA
ncbi:MAG: hypothetical protein GX820_08305 [Bacteroidales bacterium]|nr:hypothetical protein [Bacteroidales bacterium]